MPAHYVNAPSNIRKLPITDVVLYRLYATTLFACFLDNVCMYHCTDAPCVLLQEVARLKGDKLELLRQNVAAQREVKRLRERELQLSSDLGLATREVQRLRCWHMLLEYSIDNGGLM